MSSLQELCQKNITNSLYNMPPMMQEIIIGETKEQMRKQILEELKEEIEQKKRQEKKCLIQYLILFLM